MIRRRYPTTHEVGWTWENEEDGVNVDLVLTIEVEPGEERTVRVGGVRVKRRRHVTA